MQSNDAVGEHAFGPGFQPYKVTLAGGVPMYLIVMEDTVVASDDTKIVGNQHHGSAIFLGKSLHEFEYLGLDGDV